MSAATRNAAPAAGERVHTSEQFAFIAQAGMAEVFPLFGGERERLWAPGWDPQFLWPPGPADREGMVFQLAHGDATSTWVNTTFDARRGRIQYVYVLPGVVATLITLDVRPHGTQTEVSVSYQRTALSPASDAAIEEMARKDREAGSEWATQINAWLRRSPTR